MGRNAVLRRVLIAAIAFVGVLLIAGIGVAIFVASLSAQFDDKRTALSNSSVFPTAAPRPTAPAGAAARSQNILFLGSDTRGSAPTSLAAIRAQRSDTMMLVHIPANRKHVYVMSIMRDSWVTIPGYAHAKINAALSYGGVPLVVETLENLLHVRIDHVAVTSFTGFKAMTDALGGVSVDNQVAFSNGGYTFPTGTIELNGTKALWYVRARYPFPDGDYQRVRDQQAFMKGVMLTALSGRTVFNPAKITTVVNTVAPYMLTDKGLDAAYIASMAVSLHSVHANDVTFFTAPTTGTGTADGQSIVNLDFPRIAQIGALLRSDRMDEWTPCPGDTC